MLYADVPEQGTSPPHRHQRTVKDDEQAYAEGNHYVLAMWAVDPFDVHDKHLFRDLLIVLGAK